MFTDYELVFNSKRVWRDLTVSFFDLLPVTCFQHITLAYCSRTQALDRDTSLDVLVCIVVLRT